MAWLAYSMPVNQVNNTGKKDADRYDLYCAGDWRKKPTLIKLKKYKWNTDTYRWSKCGLKSVSFFAVYHCGLPSLYLLMASLCAFSSPVSLVVPRTEVKREERGMVPAMGGLMLNVSAEQTLRIFAGGVRGWNELPVSCQTSTDIFLSEWPQPPHSSWWGSVRETWLEMNKVLIIVAFN